MEDNSFAMPIPTNAISCCNYRDAYGTILFRIISMPDGQFIAQDNRSSLGFSSKEDAERFLFTVNQ